MTINKILFHMMHDMLDGEHHLLKTADGLFVANSHSPIWVSLSNNCPESQVGAFFRAFLAQNPYPITGIVAERGVAISCANIVSDQGKRTFDTRELVAYFLPHGTVTKHKTNRACKLRLAGPDDFPTVKKWLTYFYEETLKTPSPELSAAKPVEPQNGKLSLYILADPHPVAMGMISNSGEVSRLNLIYTPVEERRKGYGGAIVSLLADTAHKQGRTALLYTSGDNAAANGLYRSLGFIEAGRLTEIRFSPVFS